MPSVTIAVVNSNTTLDTLGRPIRDLRISLTDLCNLRCGYCMPAEVFDADYPFLSKDSLLSTDELVTVVEAFLQLGVRKLRLTGGEPLLRPEVVDVVRRLSALGKVEDLALTTNGLRLRGFAGLLAKAGLQRVTVSLDAMDEAVFQKMSGRQRSLQGILEGIDLAVEAGLRVKINTVIQKGINEDQILPLARYFKEKGINLRFIEYMDVGNCNRWTLDQVVTSEQIRHTLSRAFSLEPLNPNYRGEVANRYRYTDDGVEVGFVSSISQPFCSQCNRARLSADGQFYTCLFAHNGWDLKTPVRKDKLDVNGLARIIARIWTLRGDRYSELRAQQTGARKVEMSYIGG